MTKRSSHILALAAVLAGATSLGAQGTVQLKEEKPGLAKRAKVAFAQATATAQAKVPDGKLDTAELEEEGGKLIYTMIFKTAGKSGVDEVNVDAITGTVVAVEHESPEVEAKAEKGAKTEKAGKTGKAKPKVPAKKP